MEETIRRFFVEVERGQIEIYNEFSLQHEFGIFLRNVFDQNWKIEFERHVSFFEIAGTVKREIDLVLYRRDLTYKVAIEFKCPRNGQYPEQMFKACQDISFAEQMVEKGFDLGVFIMAVEDPLFHTGRHNNDIYAYFRGNTPLTGTIRKPTGMKDEQVFLTGTHSLKWNGPQHMRYMTVFIERTSEIRSAIDCTMISP